MQVLKWWLFNVESFSNHNFFLSSTSSVDIKFKPFIPTLCLPDIIAVTTVAFAHAKP